MFKVYLVLFYLLVMSLQSCKSAQYCLERGDEHYARAEYELALTYYQEAMDMDPNLPDVRRKWKDAKTKYHMRLGLASYDAGKWDESTHHFEIVLNLNPEYSEATLWLDKVRVARAEQYASQAERLLSEDRTYEALRMIEEAEQIAPENEKVREVRVRLAGAKEERERSAEKHYHEALLHLGEGRLEIALEELERCLALNPYHPEASIQIERVRWAIAAVHFEKGKALEQQEKWEEALLEYQKAEKHMASYPGATDSRRRVQNHIEGLFHLRTADQAATDGQWALARKAYELAYELCSKGREEVKLKLEEAKEKQAEVDYERAVALEAECKYEEALALYDEIASFKPDFKDVAVRRARLMTALPTARRAYEQGVRYERQRYLTMAISRFEDAESILPGYRDALSRSKALSKLVERARGMYKHARECEDEGDFDKALTLLGELRRITFGLEDADLRFDRLNERKADAQTHFEKAAKHETKKEIVLALTWYEACEKIWPNFPGVKERKEKCLRVLEKVLRMYRRAVEAHEQRKYKEALELFEQIEDTCSNYRDVRERIAELKKLVDG